MVGLPTSVPFSGDVPLLLREAPTPKCSYLTGAESIIIVYVSAAKLVFSLIAIFLFIRIYAMPVWGKHDYICSANQTITVA